MSTKNKDVLALLIPRLYDVLAEFAISACRQTAISSLEQAPHNTRENLRLYIFKPTQRRGATGLAKR